MSNRDALLLCPHLTLVPPRMKLYKIYSKKVMSLLLEYTYKVEQFSIDEAWMDVTDLINYKTNAKDIAYTIKDKIKKEIGVTVSVGISYNKVLAKLASDIASRDSIYEINEKIFKNIIWKRPVKDIIGVGKKTNEKLNSMNLFTIEDLAKSDVKLIKAVLNKHGETLWKYANGIDDSVVNYEQTFPKSIGNSHTAIKDICDWDDAKGILLMISEQVGNRLRRYNARASTISITIKATDFRSFTRQKKCQGYLVTTKNIYNEALNLLVENWNKEYSIRLLGISLSGIQYYEEQLSFNESLTENDLKEESIDNVLDSINNKYGKTLISRAASLSPHKLYTKDN